MKSIYFDDINFSCLSKQKMTNNKESVLFHNNDTIYKFFVTLSNDERKRKQQKVEILSSEKISPIIINPKEQIICKNLDEQFEGYTMDYIKSSKTLYKAFVKNKRLSILLPILITISKSLEEIHSNPMDIVISDLHAENIIVDKNYKPYIIDIDSCKIATIKNDSIPTTLKYYLLNRNLFHSIEETKTTKNTDKLSFLMMSLGLIFNKHVDDILMNQYDKVAERIIILQTMREIVLEIKKCKTIPEVPYFHEIIIENDLQLIRTKNKK